MHVGAVASKQLAKKFNALDDITDANIEKLQEIKGIGKEIAQSVCDFFSNEQNRYVIKKLLSYGISIAVKPQVAHKETIFTGKSICFTGVLSSMSRSEAKGLAEAMGGNVVDSVSKKLGYLVAGADAGSKLDKAQSLGIQVLSEEQFLEMIKGT